MTMRSLADTADLPYRTLQDYLRGTHSIPAVAIAKIASALEVSADWILRERGAQFDVKITANCLSIIEDVRQLSTHQQPWESCAVLFTKFYNREYADTYGPRPGELVANDSDAPTASDTTQKKQEQGPQ
jgi:transcriptional regulator with XRE-family HTH domain